MLINGKRPNFLILMNDEERFPPPYENPEAREWRLANSVVRKEIASHGLEFRRHYTGATACAPARATLFTGQYPSLHGVTQTPGIAKASSDPAMFWLDPGTVPTLGDYFRAAGYETYYRGKWHASDADIMVPGSNNGLLSNDAEGNPYPEKVALYETSGRLEKFGFAGWIGPEPHGALLNNSGIVRDPGFARQAKATIEQLDARARQGEENKPWVMVVSFVNPHDIVFSGPLLRAAQWFPEFYQILQNNPELLPRITPPPTLDEALQTKPRVQQDYVLQYPRMYMPQPVNETYFQLYYWLMAEVDKHFHKVYRALKESCFFDNTIVVLTADHGDLLGAHGGMQQKWHNAYEECIHVPMFISNPALFKTQGHRTTDKLSSHLDLLPTLLGLAGVDQARVREELALTHTEAQPLVGRDLSQWVLTAVGNAGETAAPSPEEAPIYFMTDDQVSLGLQQVNALGQPYRAIIQPNSVETVLARLPGPDGAVKLWKCSRYFDNPRFGVGVVGRPAIYAPNSGATPILPGAGPGNLGVGNADAPYTSQATGEMPVPDEWECYNLDDDPYEQANLLSPLYQHPDQDYRTKLDEILRELKALVRQQSLAKRKLPQNNNAMPEPGEISFLK